ncbi:hypothetical protein CTEN210_13639 [Chaetoceros tenuissimus]|uniref:Leucine-rich repeat domain-containing protein n=1 Tax=Chaetoceros tenuissimus TaxID=426638 RepID=A0AAD3D3P4_9STRA|nr:hypothetical protein CTEN210_13639 [Chaetoceros tenuissimus]
MRVQTEEWQRFIPGVRMYKGKKTLFYNGEILSKEIPLQYYGQGIEFLIYDEEERQSWEAIIVLPGVEVIAYLTFVDCIKVEAVIMADSSVRRIEESAFQDCYKLAYVKLSRNLEYIGRVAFFSTSLISVFIPPSCTRIDSQAFNSCDELIIFHVPQDTELYGWDVFHGTNLLGISPVEMNNEREVEDMDNEVSDWIKNINNDEQYALHRACSSFDPSEDYIYGIVQRERSLAIFKQKNSIGITPSQYLSANPYAEVTEQMIIKRFVLEIMGEL